MKNIYAVFKAANIIIQINVLKTADAVEYPIILEIKNAPGFLIVITMRQMPHSRLALAFACFADDSQTLGVIWQTHLHTPVFELLLLLVNNHCARPVYGSQHNNQLTPRNGFWIDVNRVHGLYFVDCIANLFSLV